MSAVRPLVFGPGEKLIARGWVLRADCTDEDEPGCCVVDRGIRSDVPQLGQDVGHRELERGKPRSNPSKTPPHFGQYNALLGT